MLNQIKNIRASSLKFAEKVIAKKTLGAMRIAYKMLVSQRNKFISMIIGTTFASFIMTQQPAIYSAISQRTAFLINAIPEADLWVMNKNTQFQDTGSNFDTLDVYRVSSIPGVLWANNIARMGALGLNLTTNNLELWEIIGVDDTSLLGAPTHLLSGLREDLRKKDTIIVDKSYDRVFETGKKVPIKIGDPILLNNKFLVTIVGTSPRIPSITFEPNAFASITTLKKIFGNNLREFILVKAKPGVSIHELGERIFKETGYIAYTSQEFRDLTIHFYRNNTPLLLNFAITSTLGFIIGVISMGQIFYALTLTHLYQFGILKMYGMSNQMITKMLLFQALIVSGIGYLLGVILASLFGVVTHFFTILAYNLTLHILIGVAAAITLIISIAAYLSIRVVLKFDTVELCRNSSQ